jgi:type II restriction enzyme
MTGSLADRFKSGSQKAGNVTEAWGAENFYCPNCSSPKLDWLKPGNKASDYKCPGFGFWYQLKSKKSPIGKSIRDGAYAAMMEAIREDRAPSYYFLHYDLATWSVRNLLLVPSFAFPPSAINQCPPLSPTARRAGWVGCNFNLSRIPADARIVLVCTAPHPDPLPPGEGTAIAPLPKIRQASHRRPADGNSPSPWGEGRDEGGRFHTFITPPNEIRAQFKKVKPLKELSVKERGWTLDVLNGVRSLGKKEFTNADAYALERRLERFHPDNRHVRDKIRQQLQVLRDAKLLIHVGSGVWRLP